MLDYKRHSNRELIRFFQSRLTELSPETSRKYARVISDLDIFLTGHHLQLSDISETLVTDWAYDLLRGGLAISTVVSHLNILNSLYNYAAKNDMAVATEAPRVVVRKLEKQLLKLPPLLKEETFSECISLLREALKRTALATERVSSGEGEAGEEGVCEDVLLFSVLNGAMPMKDVIMLKKSGAEGASEASRRIVTQNSDPRRAFVFNLRQSFNTPKQLMVRVSEVLRRRYGRFLSSGSSERSLKSGSAKGNEAFDADRLARAVWIACAVRGGATYSEAVTLIGASPRSEAWIKTVNSLLTHEMPRWYAMHMRKGVSYTDLLKEIGESVRPVPELFYPSETIRKRVGGKIVISDKPFISSTLFFRTFPDRILPMFSRIGDKAWCYRISREAGAPYAVISGADMRRFQAVIGVFTPDTEVLPIGQLTPRPGEPVMVIKAGYGNRQGEIEEVIGEGSGSMIFRVKLSTDQGYEWRLDLSPQQIQLLS